MIRAHLFISGRVQGVCFRAATEEMALSLDLKGWVCNRPDGKVEALLEGDEEKVQKMIAWCHQGPPAARVTEVKVDHLPYRGDCSDFRVL